MPQLDIGVLARPERLASLLRARTLLAAPSSSIDGLVRLASQAVDAPLGLLTLVDQDRLHIVGSHNLPAALAGSAEVPLGSSYCQFVVSDDAPLVIGDARREPAFADLPALTRLGAVAYLGQPIRDTNGNPLGAVCVADRVPRRWTDEDLANVASAAHLVETMLHTEGSREDAVLGAAETDAILDTTIEAFVAIELTGEVVTWNNASERTFGWLSREAIGKHIDDLIIPDRFRPSHRAGLARLARGGVPRLLGQRLQLWAMHRDGREFPIEMTLNVIERGGRPYAHAFLYDISERVAAERELSRERRFLEALLDNLDAGVVACDERGRLVLFNRAMRDIVGAEPDGATSDRWVERYNAQDTSGRPMPDHDLPLTRAFNGEHVRDAEFMVQNVGTRSRSFVANGQPIRDADGARLGAVVALHEVTERRRAQRFVECELSVARVLDDATSVEEAGSDLLQAVSRTLRWPHSELWLVDKVGNVLRIAASWTDPRYTLKDFLPGPLRPGGGLSGRAWSDNTLVWIADISDDPDLADRRALAEQGLKVGLSVPIRHGGGVTGVMTFFGDAAEPPDESLMALLSGISAQIGQFLERRRAEDLTRELSRTKDEFIALVGHELRTPLTSISSYTELLLDDSLLPEERAHFVAVISRNAETLRVIIDDLLDLAGLESGYVTMTEHEFNLAAEVGAVIQDNDAALVEKGLTLDASVIDAAPVSGDAARIRQVVDHLVSNAVKYTPSGGRITIALDNDCGSVTLRVSDTGLGVPEEERQRLFERFYRGSNVRNQGLPGSGLGLAISRTVVERHGGTITMTDNGEEPGTTFVVKLPLSGVAA